MAGGRGTRIQTVAGSIPKPLIKIDGIPVLEREIVCLRRQGFTDIILTVGYRAQAIIDYFGDGGAVSPSTGKAFGVTIDYFVEDQPLGNAGALFRIKDKLTDDFLLLNADSMFDVDLNRFVDYHKSHGASATIFTHPNNHPYDSGVIVADENHAVKEWLSKEDDRPLWYKNRVNAGLHVLNKSVIDSYGGTIEEDGRPVKIDLDRDILKPLAGSGKMFCYDSPEYVKDMGTPDRFRQVETDVKSGLVRAKNLANRQKAVFLDRDGTLNKYVGFLRNIDDFELLPGVSEAIRKINSSGCLAVVVTNQPVIARGEVTVEELQTIHNKLETLLGEDGAYIDGLYYCPHHPDSGFEGEIPELKIECGCRKPKPGMLLQAARDFNISLDKSYMVGDSKDDIAAGKNAGCRTVLLTGGGAGADNVDACGQDYTFNSLLDFADNIDL